MIRVQPVADTPPLEIEEKVLKAREAFEIWRSYSLPLRVKLLRKLWKEISRRRQELIQIVHEESGQPKEEVEMIGLCTAELVLKFYLEQAVRVLSDQASWRPWIFFTKRSYIRRVPRGVVGVIAPWNFPFLISWADSVPALLAGNAVLLKPSEWTPRTALFLEGIIQASGLFPEGLFQVVLGGPAAAEKVIRASDLVVMTGSASAGRAVSKLAGELMKPAILELGGKHAMIVCQDADLDRAVPAAVWGSLARAGQMCIAVENVLVEEAIYPAFLEKVLAQVKDIKEEQTGPMVLESQFSRVRRQLEDARAHGAQVYGGEVLGRLKMKPAVAAPVTTQMLLFQEETFGPVVAVTPFGKMAQAVHWVNDRPYGLSASVWSRDLRKAETASRQLEVGMVGINELSSHFAVASLPFGGFKQSGLWYRHGEDGLKMFCKPQSVLVHEWPSGYPELWWYPYSSLKTKIVSWLARLS